MLNKVAKIFINNCCKPIAAANAVANNRSECKPNHNHKQTDGNFKLRVQLDLNFGLVQNWVPSMKKLQMLYFSCIFSSFSLLEPNFKAVQN